MAKPKVRWFDDWFAIEEIAPGPGLRDITPVVASRRQARIRTAKGLMTVWRFWPDPLSNGPGGKSS
ncbi:MAG: hypothetical protein E6G89_05760 [Alphaproteobacteria bacterium]|nr:MAG: hypothetical protein E6G89_05760 [Alphaproteobacteria bacterium]